MRFEIAQIVDFHNLMLKLMVNPTSMTPNFDLIHVVNSTINRRYKHGDSFSYSLILVAQDLTNQMKVMHATKKPWEHMQVLY